MAGGYHERFKKLIKEVRPRISTVSHQELSKEINQDTDQTTVIDVREHDEWKMSHIPSALSIPKSIIERDIEFHVPNLNKKIVLYSRQGYLSILAVDHLMKMGYENVHSLKGGYQAWTIGGLPIQQGGEIVYPDEVDVEGDIPSSERKLDAATDQQNDTS